MAIATLLRQTCTIQRSAVSTGADLDLVVDTGTPTTVGSAVACLFTPLKVSADMLAVGPLERDIQQLFLLPTQDIQRHDNVTDADGVVWVVTGVPQTCPLRGVAHHVEVLVEKKAVR